MTRWTPSRSIAETSSPTFVPPDSVHPDTTTSPSRASTLTSSPSGPTASSICAARDGSVAAVPTITRSTPRFNASRAKAGVRMPPPSCTGTSTAATMRATASMFTGDPVRAPSRSTTWIRSAPIAAHWRATPSGSSEYTVSLAKSPCISRTQRPLIRSIAGITCIKRVLQNL